jgi:DNA-directed RNA polymerase specialized sigma24 family protein
LSTTRVDRTAQKRGDGVQRVALEHIADLPSANRIPVLALDDALGRLGKLDAGLAQIVELRVFGGLTIDEAAHLLNVSPSTAKRDWRTAKAWLTRELGSESQS